MKVRFLRNTIANRQSFAENQIADIPEQEARFLVAIKKAEYVKDEKKDVLPVVSEAAEADEEISASEQPEKSAKRTKRKE